VSKYNIEGGKNKATIKKIIQKEKKKKDKDKEKRKNGKIYCDTS
jgi:hypothetical protein